MTNSVLTPGSSVTILAAPLVINGVATNVSGVVGTATKGPVNIPTPVNGQEYASIFGSPQARKYDAGTLIQAGALNGLATVYMVRVTDGTDAYATGNAVTNAVVSSLYTGSGYNGAVVNYGAGGKANTISVSVSLSGQNTELFPNLPAANAAVFWAAHDAAINTGAGVMRGPSATIKANSANAVALPSLPTSVTLSGGTDGAAGVTAATLIGVDGVNGTQKSGMYALRGLGVQYAALADGDNASYFTTQAAFGQSENMLMVGVLPAGTVVSNAVTAVQNVGLDSQYFVTLHGDWLQYADPVNGLRLISPQGYYLGMRASLLPNQSALNKPLNGINASQRSIAGGPYASPETDLLAAAGIELIANPIPYGAAWGAKIGRTSSSLSGQQNSDAWTSLTNYLVATLEAASGKWIGEPNTVANRAAVAAAVSHFFSGLVSQGILANDDAGNPPYSVTCNSTNNSLTSISQGFMNVLVVVQYEAIVWELNYTLQGGASVQVASNLQS